MRITRKQISNLVEVINATALHISLFEINDEQQAIVTIKYKQDYFKFSVTKLDGTQNINGKIYYGLDIYPVDRVTGYSISVWDWEQVIESFKQWIIDVEEDILTVLPKQSSESSNPQKDVLIGTFKTTVNDLLVKDKFDEMFNFLFTTNQDGEMKHSLIIAKSEYKVLQKHIINNTMDNQELSLSRNRLISRILKVVEEIAKQIGN